MNSVLHVESVAVQLVKYDIVM